MRDRKRLILVFLLAFVVRVGLATMYTPVGPLNDDGTRGNCDQVNYMRMNRMLLEGTFTKSVTLLLTPFMLVGRIFEMDDLTGTIAGGCLIGALSVIPLWFISRKIGVSPLITTFLYAFSPLDIGEVLTWGGYSLLLGLLAINTYVLLAISGKKWAPIVLIPSLLTHNTSSLYFAIFVVVMTLFSLLRHRRVEQWMIATLIIVVPVVLLKYGCLLGGYNQIVGLDSVVGESDYGTPSVLSVRFYLFILGPLTFALILLGLAPFYRENRDSMLLLSWVILPHLAAFIPIFTNPSLNIRLLAYGAGGVAVLSCYALERYKKNKLVKTTIVSLILMNIVLTLILAVERFGVYGI